MKRTNRSQIAHHALSQDEEEGDDIDIDLDLDLDVDNDYESGGTCNGGAFLTKPRPPSSPALHRSRSSLLANNDDDTFECHPSTRATSNEVKSFMFESRMSNVYNGIGQYNTNNAYSSTIDADNSEDGDRDNETRKLDPEEFMEKMHKYESATPRLFPPWMLLALGFAVLFSSGLYLAFSGRRLPQFNGLAFGDDGDEDDDDDDYYHTDFVESESAPEAGDTSSAEQGADSNTNEKCSTQESNVMDEKALFQRYGIKYNPNATLDQNDAFRVGATDPTWYGGIFQSPPHPSIPASLLLDHTANSDDGGTAGGASVGAAAMSNENVGYIQHPDVFNNTLVFCSEGDVYLTTIPSNIISSPLAAMRLTSTVGNVNSPKINPKYPYLIAFTATYTGHREVYLMDLRSNHRSNPSMRLTYMDSTYGVNDISGWEDDGSTLVVSSYNMEVAMEDVRLYKIAVIVGDASKVDVQNGQRRFVESSPSSSAVTVSSVTPVPLSQAIDATVDAISGCRFFTRYKQSSNTIRYVGGTAEKLWAYCPDKSQAVPLTDDYNGTSKSPEIYTASNGRRFLFFLSDRTNDLKTEDSNKWVPSTMNLWFAPLPLMKQMYENKNKPNLSRPLQLTTISCQFGMPLQEYAIDKETGDIVMRIGADLHTLQAADIEQTLLNASIGPLTKLSSLPIAVYSDFNNLHERMIPMANPSDVSTIDIFGTQYGSISVLMTARGQVFVNPIVPDTSTMHAYGGGGMNMPARRYRIAPGSTTGGMLRILGSFYIPSADDSNPKALVLATDPMSPTAEMAFYILDVSASSAMDFTDVTDLPTPFLGGHLNGGSAKDGGLGSILVDSVTLSPCGRRFAWTNTDGDICCMSFPTSENQSADFVTLPKTNDSGEPMIGIEAELKFSPGGRYLAIEHNARNKFAVITIGDLGDPSDNSITLKRFVQATPDRFNSMNPLWGRSPVDFKTDSFKEEGDKDDLSSTTLFFLTDRDVVLTQNSSPWGTRAPQPFFGKRTLVYALPLISKEDEMSRNPYEEVYGGSFVGGGAAELMIDHLNAWNEEVSKLSEQNETATDVEQNEASFEPPPNSFPSDIEISFGDQSDTMAFSRRAYVISEIPVGEYIFLHQLIDDASLILCAKSNTGMYEVVTYAFGSFPGNSIEEMPIQFVNKELQNFGVSSDRKYVYFTYSGQTKVFGNNAADFMKYLVQDTAEYTKNIVDTDRWVLNVWPKLEYQQLYSDAWRMLRDYYYDPNMGNVDWNMMHDRYLPLVARCGRREELDDVLKQMAAELSALHVFVYGGEYNDPLHGNINLRLANQVASLGAVLERSAEWGGYIVKEIPEVDPDFNPLDGRMIYSPLSDKTLKLTGQRGLLEGDVIVGVNGEAAMAVPDIHMLFRGMAGRSIRLDVLRIKSQSSFGRDRRMVKDAYIPEPVIVVPLGPDATENLRYAAWEWKTRNKAKELAEEQGFSVGYMHLRSMSGAEGEDSFVRGFYPDFDKQGLIVDVRHNHGGNIDSWLLDVLQRKAWMYWQGRATNVTTGGLGWDEQFAFRGHLVILIDEKTSSDGEGFSRGVSELGLGKLVGTRTWGGGIWLSSDNKLVDGGIATAPEYGTYNAKLGWGLGIEQMGVEPDIVIDNDPRETFDGKDRQLEEAITILKNWLEGEPIVLPKNPGPHRDMALRKEVQGCAAVGDDGK